VAVRCRSATRRRSSIKIAAPLAKCTKEEQRSVIRFLSTEGVKPIKIHSSVTDSPRPGQAHRVVTPEAIAAVEAFVKENRRVTMNEIE